MHEIIDFLKNAVERGNAAGINGCYVVQAGNIYARNMTIQAGIAWDTKAVFTVSADAVDAALSRMKGEVTLKVNSDNIVFKYGKLTSTIERIHETPPSMPDFPKKGWRKYPSGLGAALKLAKPFVGERIWQLGTRLYQDRVTAFSGHGGIDITVPGLAQEQPILLAQTAVNFIIAQGDPDEYVVDDLKCWCVRWDDGRWVRAQQLIGEMPENIIENIFKTVGTDAPVKLTDEWREAVEDAEALSDNTVMVTAKGLTGKRANITTEVAMKIDVPKEHTSYWKADLLKAMLDVADCWNPDSYRKQTPALFKGKNVRGVLAGYRA